MPRFQDSWLIDRVLFDYVLGGTCACCSSGELMNTFLPGGTKELIQTISDIDTDQANHEVQVYNNAAISSVSISSSIIQNPWPKDLQDYIWSSRVRLRQKLKQQSYVYKQFWKEHSKEFEMWCRRTQYTITTTTTTTARTNEVPEHSSSSSIIQPKPEVDGDDFGNGPDLHRIFQLSRTELLDTLKVQYNVHSSYEMVLCAVMEQVSHFHLTDYDTDGIGTIEIEFEHSLAYSKFGSGFSIPIIRMIMDQSNNNNNNTKVLREEILLIWLNRMKSLGGPKLLERGGKKSTKNNSTKATTTKNKTTTNENENEEVDDEGDVDGPDLSFANPTALPSFRSDRRLLRLIIARYWADTLISSFHNYYKKKKEMS